MEAEKSRIKKNKYGQVILSSNELIKLLLQGRHIGHLHVDNDEDIKLFQQFQNELLPEPITFSNDITDDLSFDEFHQRCSNEWLFPAQYQQINVKEWLLDKCKNQEEIDRINEEYMLFEGKDLVMLLRLLIFLVDYMRKHNFIWGVGRGSSTSSYILYKIGIHRVDSIKYSLSISDYLK